MTVWDYVNIVGRLILTALAVYKVTQFGAMMIPLERLGLTMMGGGSFLTVSVIAEKRDSPFDGWAVSVLTVGAVLFVAGRAIRDRRHQKANDELIRQAREWRKA